MTVLLDKRLTERQQWALGYLADRHAYWTTATGYFDDGADFIHAYATHFKVPSVDSAMRSLQRVLRQLVAIRLVEVRDTWQEGGGYRGVGVAKANEYQATDRGCRAAISHDTYD